MRRWDQLLDKRNATRRGRRSCIILSVLSLLYAVGVRARLAAYRIGLLRRHRLPVQVISVGNITVGGTGKTPVVLYIARMLRDQGKRVVIISRGYGRKSGRDSVRIVSDGEHLLIPPRSAGDEPYLCAQKQTGVPVMVGKDRVRVGREAIARFRPEVLLLDDGFQHMRLQRDLNIVVVDASNPFDNSHLLPRGLLREPIEGLRRADLCWLTRVDQCPDLPELQDRLRSLCPGVPIAETLHRPTRLRSLDRRHHLDLEDLREKTVVALSSIGNPGAFEQTLTHLKATIHPIRFPDHHPYTSKDIQHVLRVAQEVNAWAVVTTEKDAVRWPDVDRPPVAVLVLEIEIEVVGGEDQVVRALNRTVR